MKSRRAKVVYSYTPQNEDELKLEVDELIEVLDEVEEGWWRGRIRGAIGVFPSNFVVELSTSDSPQTNKTELSSSDDNISGDNVVNDGNKQTISSKEDGVDTEKKPKPIKGVGFGDIFASGKPKLSPVDNSPIDRNKVSVPKKPPPPTPASDADLAPKLPPKPIREQAKVLFSYEAQNDDELSIKEGDIINIITKEIEDHGWWKGELSGRIGVFPDNFVELIKCLPEESSVPSRVKKPERPTEKPPPITANQFKITPSKPDITKSSNKSIDELPKSSVVLNAGSSNAAPLIHGKKPTTHPQKPKSDVLPPNSTSSIKPDVVPHENGNKLDKDSEPSKTPLNASTVIANTSANESNQFNPIDTSGNKLTHLTAQRPKGPSSRRPPSTIFIPKESPNDSKENGDISIIKSDKSDVNISNSTSAEQIKPTQAPTQPEKSEKLPPWMLELRKAQEKRKETPDESPKDTTKAPLSSPTKTSPNRFSGDFGNKIIHQTSLDDSSDASAPIHLLKPLKLTKPTVTNITSSTGSAVSNTSITTTGISNQSSIAASSVVFSTNLTSKTSNVVINSTNISATNATSNTAPIKTTKEEDSVVEKKELSDLHKEIEAIKESMVPRKDFDELVKQVSELKELVESQKQSYTKVIKDLINDVAEEKKKLATLHIEIERLRKLTTTV